MQRVFTLTMLRFSCSIFNLRQNLFYPYKKFHCYIWKNFFSMKINVGLRTRPSLKFLCLSSTPLQCKQSYSRQMHAKASLVHILNAQLRKGNSHLGLLLQSECKGMMQILNIDHNFFYESLLIKRNTFHVCMASIIIDLVTGLVL